jgi:hypothetical protein
MSGTPCDNTFRIWTRLFEQAIEGQGLRDTGQLDQNGVTTFLLGMLDNFEDLVSTAKTCARLTRIAYAWYGIWCAVMIAVSKIDLSSSNE